MIKFLYAAILGIIGAIIVHILVLFLVPHYARPLLWRELDAAIPPYYFAPPPKGSIIAQTADPFFRLRLCRFDLEESPVHITARGAVPFWSLSFYTQKGENIYSISSSTAPDAKLDIVAIDPSEAAEFKHNAPAAYENSAYAALTGSKNFIVLRILLPSPDLQKQTENFLSSLKCARAEY